MAGAPKPDRLAALLAPLRGIGLTEPETKILRWIACWEQSTVDTVASILHRARTAEPPVVPAEVVLLDQDDDGTFILVCPHDGCDARNSIRNEVHDTHLEEPLNVELGDREVVVEWNGDWSSGHQHVRYVCSACNRPVLLAEPTEAVNRG